MKAGRQCSLLSLHELRFNCPVAKADLQRGCQVELRGKDQVSGVDVPPDIGDTQKRPPSVLVLLHHEHGAKLLGLLGVNIHLEYGVVDPVFPTDPGLELLVVLHHRRDDAGVLVAGADPERAAGLYLSGRPNGREDENEGDYKEPCWR